MWKSKAFYSPGTQHGRLMTRVYSRNKSTIYNVHQSKKKKKKTKKKKIIETVIKSKKYLILSLKKKRVHLSLI